MDAMMQVEVLNLHGHLQSLQRVRGAGAQCRIGRSLACDLTVDDAHVAAEHVVLTLLPDGDVQVRDCGTRNGTVVDGKRLASGGTTVVTNAELEIGRTLVRVRAQEGTLAPERVLHRDTLRRHQTAFAAAGLVLCSGFAAFMQWIRAPVQLAQLMVITMLLLAAALAVWVAAWALVSRLTVGAWLVRVHLAIATFCVGLWGWGHWVYSVGAFALQWRWLGPVAAGLAACVALGAAYLHLRSATHLPRLASLLLAVFAPLLCGGVWWLVNLQIDPRTVNRVEPGPAIFPPAVRLAPSTDLGDYLADAAALKREANMKRQQSLLQTPVLDTAD